MLAFALRCEASVEAEHTTKPLKAHGSDFHRVQRRFNLRSPNPTLAALNGPRASETFQFGGAGLKVCGSGHCFGSVGGGGGIHSIDPANPEPYFEAT